MFYFRLDDDSELRLLEPRHAENLFLLTDKSRKYLREWLPWVDFTKEVSNSKEFIEGTLKQFGNNTGIQAAGKKPVDSIYLVFGIHYNVKCHSDITELAFSRMVFF